MIGNAFTSPSTNFKLIIEKLISKIALSHCSKDIKVPQIYPKLIRLLIELETADVLKNYYLNNVLKFDLFVFRPISKIVFQLKKK